jgi:hypothetical protein
VGISGFNPTDRTLAEVWNGKRWSIVPSPNNGTASNDLYGVSCLSASSCFAVGGYTDGTSGNGQALVESWNGSTWSIVPGPNISTNTYWLGGVSCVSASFCAAVGQTSSPGTNDQTLVETWNGTSWSIVLSPNAGTSGSYLDSVSCISASSCMAVGSYGTSSNSQTLVEAWNGSSWSVVSSPNGTSNNYLRGVSCVSASSCTAVGYGYPAATLVEAWNGSTWSIVPSPNSGTRNSFLLAVSCFSTSSCAAVGSSSIGLAGQTLVETWNGISWTVVLDPISKQSDLNGVSCVSASSCTAVGYYANTNGRAVPLVEVS